MRVPGFTAAMIATIALAVGAGCSVFALVNAVLLRPLPFPEPDRLVGLWHTMPGLNVPLAKQALGTYAVYRDDATSFESMGLHITLAATLTYPTPDVAVERARVDYVTASTFETLRARPLLGRLLVASDEKPGAGTRRGDQCTIVALSFRRQRARHRPKHHGGWIATAHCRRPAGDICIS